MDTNTRLIDATNSTEAIQIAYRSLNAKNELKKNISMNALRMKAGIPSRGYFSMVMNGQRLLHPKYAEPLARVFKLDGFERDLFLALLARDHETNSTKRRQLKAAITKYRKLLSVDESNTLPKAWGLDAFIGDVLCSFSLFPEGAEQDQILRLFPERRHDAVVKALKNLCMEGYIKKDGPRYLVVKKGTVFVASQNKFDPARYVASSFLEASQLAQVLNGHIDQCYLTSISVSVKKSAYKDFLDEIKKKIMEWVIDVDDDNGDQIIRVNVGIYPVVPALDAVEASP